MGLEQREDVHVHECGKKKSLKTFLACRTFIPNVPSPSYSGILATSLLVSYVLPE